VILPSLLFWLSLFVVVLGGTTLFLHVWDRYMSRSSTQDG
jgi:hypothetical protein